MPSSLIRSVNTLKESLASQQNAKSDDDTCMDLLQRLDELPMDLNTLTQTLIGTVVSKFKKNPNKDIAMKAKGLIKKWKSIAKDSKGAAAGASAGATTAPTPPSSAVKSNKAPVGSSPPSTSNHTTQQSSTPPEPSAFDDLPPFRKKMATKLYSIFQLSKSSLEQSGVHADAIAELTTSRASELENAIDQHGGPNKQKYQDKLRSLVFNLKKNAPLLESVILGQVSAAELVKMPPERLVTAEKSKEMYEKVKSLKDSRRLDWEQANESKINEMCGIKGDLLKASLFTCGRCKSTKTTSTQKQTRSADEPMTVFVLCLNCGNRWKT